MARHSAALLLACAACWAVLHASVAALTGACFAGASWKQEALRGAQLQRADGADKVATKEKPPVIDAEPAAAKAKKDASDGLDYAAWAAEARNMAKEAREEFEKGGKDSATARGKEILLNGVAPVLDAAAGVEPSWAPLAGAGAVLLALVLTVSSAVSSIGSRAPSTAPVASTPVVVAVKKAAPVVAEPPKSAPSKPLPAPKAAPVQAAVPAASTATELPWARTLADFSSSALRAVADGLPTAERVVETEIPVVEEGLKWVSGVTPENAASKITNDILPAAGNAAGEALRVGLKVGGSGLEVAAENLPAAGRALQTATVNTMPFFQSALRGVADGAEFLAEKVSEVQPAKNNEVLRQVEEATPGLLKGAAAGLDALADAAPQLESAAAFVGDKALPIVSATLKTTGELAEAASTLPPPRAEDVEKAAVSASTALKSVGIDTQKIAASAQNFAQKAAANLSKATAPKPAAPVTAAPVVAASPTSATASGP